MFTKIIQLPDNQYNTGEIYIGTYVCGGRGTEPTRQCSVASSVLACLCHGGGMMGIPPIKTINAQALHQSVSFTEDPPPPSGNPTSRLTLFPGFCSL